MAANGESINAQSVITEIENLKKPDGILTEDENKQIDKLYDQVDSVEGKKQVRDYISNSLEGETQTKLLRLLQNIENQNITFGMELLSEKSDSKIFNMVLKNPFVMAGYEEMFIGDKIKSNSDLFPEPNGQKTLEIVYWNKITNELGIKSSGAYAFDKAGGFLTGMINSIGNVGKNVDTDSMDISYLGNIIDKLKKIGGSDEELSEKQEKQIGGIFKKIEGYLDFMTKDYTSNLNILIELGKSDTNGLKKLLDNPVVLNEVLETGKYDKDGYTIDLANKKVSFNKNPDLEKSKKEFMNIVVESTNKNGKIIDTLKENGKKLAGFFEKLGFDSNSLRELREELKDIPLIGKFLHMLLGFFISDSLLDIMDKSPWDKEYKNSGKKLQVYIKDNKEKLPFTYLETDLDDSNTVLNIETFLKKVDSNDKDNFINTQTAESKKKGEKRLPLIDNETFWTDIFSEVPLENKLISEQIRLEVIAIKKKDKDITTKELFEKLCKITISIPGSENLKNKNGARENLPTKIISFPAKINLPDGTKKDVKFENNKLKVGTEEFVLENNEIIAITFEGNNVNFNLKDSAGTVTTKQVSNSEFGKILVSLATGVAVTNTKFNFLTSAKKELLLQEKVQSNLVKETANLTTELNNLTPEVVTLSGEVNKLQNDLKLIDSDLLKETKVIENKTIELNSKQKNLDGKKIKVFKLKNELNLIEAKIENRGYLDIGLSFLGDDETENKNNLIKQIKKIENDTGILIVEAGIIKKELPKLKQNLDTLNKQKDTIQKEFDTKNALLSTKNTRVNEIKTKLGANNTQVQALESQIEAQKVQQTLEEEEKIRIAEEEVTRKRIKEEQRILNMPKFSELLEKPVSKTSTELILSNETKIVFNKSKVSLNIGNDEFKINSIGGDNEGFGFNKNLIKMKLGFSFEDIYNTPGSKRAFILVLNDLKTTGKSQYNSDDLGLIEFGKA